MSIMKTEDVKTLRDVQSMFNDLDNKITDMRNAIDRRLSRIESDCYEIEHAFNNEQTRSMRVREIEEQCREIRSMLFDSNRTF